MARGHDSAGSEWAQARDGLREAAFPILVVGNLVVDLVLEVGRHPREDEELRAEGMRLEVGGNAANTTRVLAALGHHVALAAVLPGPPWEAVARAGLTGVDLGPCRRGRGHALSVVLLDRRAGTRTIVHHRDLPEYPAGALEALAGRRWCWVHVEARDGHAQAPLLARLRAAGVPVSLEVEKTRPGLEKLLSLATVVVFSRPFARTQGLEEPSAAAEALARRTGRPTVVTWGEAGAALGLPGEAARLVLAAAPGPVVDTLGAGDVLNAGLVDALARGAAPVEALRSAVALAGRRCTVPGLGRFVAGLRRG